MKARPGPSAESRRVQDKVSFVLKVAAKSWSSPDDPQTFTFSQSLSPDITSKPNIVSAAKEALEEIALGQIHLKTRKTPKRLRGLVRGHGRGAGVFSTGRPEASIIHKDEHESCREMRRGPRRLRD
uniref:Ribosomal protein L22 n=1 Tax=Knipowitschia caucasica TaxID=637954 RepID=A0AAV2JCP1_KNICA